MLNGVLGKITQRFKPSSESIQFAKIADEHRALGETDKAIQICKDGLSHHPEYVTGHYILGKCYLETDLAEDAKEAFLEGLRLKPNHLPMLLALADLLKTEGNVAEAVQYYRSALAIDPLNTRIQSDIEQCLGDTDAVSTAAVVEEPEGMAPSVEEPFEAVEEPEAEPPPETGADTQPLEDIVPETGADTQPLEDIVPETGADTQPLEDIVPETGADTQPLEDIVPEMDGAVYESDLATEDAAADKDEALIDELAGMETERAPVAEPEETGLEPVDEVEEAAIEEELPEGIEALEALDEETVEPAAKTDTDAEEAYEVEEEPPSEPETGAVDLAPEPPVETEIPEEVVEEPPGTEEAPPSEPDETPEPAFETEIASAPVSERLPQAPPEEETPVLAGPWIAETFQKSLSGITAPPKIEAPSSPSWPVLLFDAFINPGRKRSLATRPVEKYASESEPDVRPVSKPPSYIEEDVDAADIEAYLEALSRAHPIVSSPAKQDISPPSLKEAIIPEAPSPEIAQKTDEAEKTEEPRAEDAYHDRSESLETDTVEAEPEEARVSSDVTGAAETEGIPSDTEETPPQEAPVSEDNYLGQFFAKARTRSKKPPAERRDNSVEASSVESGTAHQDASGATQEEHGVEEALKSAHALFDEPDIDRALPDIRETKRDDGAGKRREGRDAIPTATLAELYVRQGLIDRAIAVYLTLIEHDPTNPEIHNRLSELFVLKAEQESP